MTVKVEFLAETSLKSAVEEACKKCYEWRVAYVEFDFNGVGISVGPNAATWEAEEQYRESSCGDHLVIN